MASIAISDARLLTMALPGDKRAPRRGRDLGMPSVISHGWVHVVDGLIADLGTGPLPNDIRATTTVHADGRVVMPAFVDCHTHACWVGDRSDELIRQFSGGVSYLDILHEGGGIMATVRSGAAQFLACGEMLGPRIQAILCEPQQSANAFVSPPMNMATTILEYGLGA